MRFYCIATYGLNAWEKEQAATKMHSDTEYDNVVTKAAPFLPSAGFMTASWSTVATLPASPVRNKEQNLTL